MAKYYYNGVLLPEIPADVLAQYPYCWIRTNTRTGHYDLLFSQSKWYAKDEDTLAHSDSNTIKWYRVEIAAADTAEAWTFNTDYSSETWGSESDRRILWTNTDIPNGSVTATDIYFEGTEQIPETYYMYNGYLLPPVPTWTGKPHYAIRRDELNNRYDVFFTAGGYYFNGSAVYCDDGIACPRFVLPLDGNGLWTYLDTNYTGFTHTTGREIVFSNINISNGKGATDIWMAASVPVPVPTYNRKYLLRSGSTIYTVADGALSALTETEVTASLFQTYGMDEIPDGALLVGLTDPEVLYWQDSTDELPVLELTVKGTPPLPQMFTSEPMSLVHESIAGIDHAAVDASEDVRFAISFDGGTTWKAFDGSVWFDTSDTVPGMLPSTMNAITAEQWAEVVVLDSYMVRFWLPNVTAYVKSVVMHYINP